MLKSRTLLVAGPREATDEFITAATPALRTPVRHHACATTLPLPSPGGTLILDDVEALDSQQQERLIHWLEEAQAGETQTIAVTTTSLYAHVQSGIFSSTLYYRLNTLYVEIGI